MRHLLPAALLLFAILCILVSLCAKASVVADQYERARREPDGLRRWGQWRGVMSIFRRNR